MNATMQVSSPKVTIPGTRVVAVRSAGAVRGYGYVGAAVYEAVARDSDGILTWRCVERPARDGAVFIGADGTVRTFGAWARSAHKALRDAEALAAHLGIATQTGVRHGTACA